VFEIFLELKSRKNSDLFINDLFEFISDADTQSMLKMSTDFIESLKKRILQRIRGEVSVNTKNEMIETISQVFSSKEVEVLQ